MSATTAARPLGAPDQQLAAGSSVGHRTRLFFFYSPTSGLCRTVERYLSGVLQRRQNHDTFDVVQVDVTEHPLLARRYAITEVPTLVVIEDQGAAARLIGNACRTTGHITDLLAPWLR